MAESGSKDSKVKRAKLDDPSNSSARNEENGENSRDRQHLLGIFPEEIWMKVLENVDAPKDSESISNSSLFFRNLLLPNRTEFLFPKVWKILGENYEKSLFVELCFPAYIASPTDFESFLEKNGRQCQVCQRWRLTKCFSGILKLRQVSKSWSNSIDNFYQTRPYYHYKLDVDPHDNTDDKYDWTVDRFGEHSLEYLDQFLRHFDQTHGISGSSSGRSPFLGRAINLMYDNLDDDCVDHHQAQQFWNGISSLLLKYGQHIWYCTLHIQDRPPRRITYYSKIREWLDQMPNLKVLDMRYRFSTAVDLTEEENVLVQLSEVIRDNPSITFDSLQCLKTSYLPTPIFNGLIRCNPHISMLEVNREHIHEDYDIYSIKMPNLAQLSIKFATLLDFRKLEDPQVEWKLTKLYLDLESCDFIDWSRIFILLENKWADTLTSLVLSLPRSETKSEENEILEKCGNLRLNLPLIEHLKITIGNLSSLDFILPMENTLQLLEITVCCDFVEDCFDNNLYETVKNSQIIKILGYTRRLLESNVWSLFPKLKRIVAFEKFNQRMERHSYSRRDWEHQVEDDVDNRRGDL